MKFEEIWAVHQATLFSFIRSKTEDEAIAEDILQEVAIKLHDNLKRKTEIRNPKTWLFQVSRNTISDHYRKHKTTPFSLLFLPTQSDDSEVCVCDLAGFVIQKYLPRIYGEPLFLSDIEQKPHKDIAQQLGLSLTATKSRVQRARKKLKELIDDCIEISYNNQQQITDFQLKADCELPLELKAEMEKINLVL